MQSYLLYYVELLAYKDEFENTKTLVVRHNLLDVSVQSVYLKLKAKGIRGMLILS